MNSVNTTCGILERICIFWSAQLNGSAQLFLLLQGHSRAIGYYLIRVSRKDAMASEVPTESEKIKQLEEMNARLLAILENQNKSNENSEGKMLECMAAHKPKNYYGDPDPTKFEEWVTYMEKLLDIIACPAHMRIRLATFYFAGVADTWCTTTKTPYRVPLKQLYVSHIG